MTIGVNGRDAIVALAGTDLGASDWVEVTKELIVPMFTELLEFQGGTMSVNYGLNKVRFPAPVPVASRIRLAARVAAVSDIAGGAEIVPNAVIELAGSTKPACVAEVVYRHIY